MTKRPGTVRLVFALSLAITLLWTSRAASQTKTYYSLPLRARSLIGLRVEDTDGQQIGRIQNLVLDTHTGTLRYAVIASGGILGLAPTLRLAPTEVMSAATTKRETLAINVTGTQWNRVPAFKASRLDSLAEPGVAQEISSHFEPALTRARQSQSLSVTGYETGVQTNGSKSDFKFATDLIGMRVVNAQQERIGEVVNLLVGFGKPRPAFAIVSTGHMFHREPEFAIPLSALTATGRDRKLILNSNAAALETAPPFDSQVWVSSFTNDPPQIFRYLKSGD